MKMCRNRGRGVCLVLLFLLLFGTGCRSGRGDIPRPEGFMRIECVDTVYRRLYPYFPLSFEIPSQAAFERDVASPSWVNIVYPRYGATLWCSYVALTTENKEAFYAESRDLVYVHAAKASSITAQSYADDERRVYAVLYNLSG